VTATARTPFTDPDIFIEAEGPWAFGAPAVALSGDGHRLRADLPVLQAPSAAPPLAGLPVTVTLVDGPRAVEHAAAVAAPGAGGAPDDAGSPGGSTAPAAAPDAPAAGAVPPAATDVSAAAVAGMLGLAVLGGLILNLMPCVLPVLSLKLLSVVGHGGQAPQRVRLGFLASAAGILASFLVLAAGAIALKAAGGAVGWGIQFQQPLFLVFMILVLTLFACNLLGVFEITLPSGLNDRLARAGGSGAGDGDGLAGHFATGAFATLLATPCSAPFLGTAVGFALSRGAAEILAVFMALGVGLALPYLAVAAMPRLATRLPRPGRWMATLKKVLSLALVLTAVWLLAVLAVQVSAAAAWAVAAAMAGLAGLLWLRRRAGSGSLRAAGGALAAVLAAAAFVVPVRLDAPAAGTGTGTGMGSGAPVPAAAAVWQPFDRARIDALVADGQVVFVDVTADWCLTCQANKALVLERGAVPAALAGTGVVAMRADWTRPDDRIAAYLAGHGRYGIPFNAAYGPGAPDGVVLPELLTESAVLDALAAAAGTARTAESGGGPAGGPGAAGG
jgi:suppressor for copper-sensitivity B